MKKGKRWFTDYPIQTLLLVWFTGRMFFFSFHSINFSEYNAFHPSLFHYSKRQLILQIVYEYDVRIYPYIYLILLCLCIHKRLWGKQMFIYTCIHRSSALIKSIFWEYRSHICSANCRSGRHHPSHSHSRNRIHTLTYFHIVWGKLRQTYQHYTTYYGDSQWSRTIRKCMSH